MDDFSHHPKVVAAGLEAQALWVHGLTFCSRYATGGVIRNDQLKMLHPIDARLLKRLTLKLIEVGLWVASYDGVIVHEYDSYQRAKAQVLRSRERANAKIKRHRERKREVTKDSNGYVTGYALPDRGIEEDRNRGIVDTPLPPEAGGDDRRQLALVPDEPEAPPPEQLVLEAYQRVFPERYLPGRSKTKTVLGQIRQRLKENFTVEQLSATAENIARNPFVDPTGKAHDGLSVAMRDEDQVRKYLPRQMTSRAPQPARASDAVNAAAAEFGYPKVCEPDAELFLELDPQLQTMRSLMKRDDMTPKKLYVAMKEACEATHAAG